MIGRVHEIRVDGIFNQLATPPGIHLCKIMLHADLSTLSARTQWPPFVPAAASPL